MLVYLTIDPVPPGHYKYALVDTKKHTGTFSNTLSDLKVNYMGDILNPIELWGVEYSTFDELIANPNVTQFTEDSHPEYFI